MARQLSVSLKAVVLVIPSGAEEKAMLEKDLRQMGCHRLMEWLWYLKYERIVVELQQKQDNRWMKTLRQDPDKWTAAIWHKVYNFSICGKGMATRGEKYVEGKFTHPPHPKDGYALSDCKDLRAKRVLEFLIPIFYPEKPVRITVTIGNTIFGAYTGEREVDWALVIRNTVKRLLAGIEKSKPTPICPYVLHLFYAHHMTPPEDKKTYMVEESMMKHNIESDEEEQLVGMEDLERKSLNSEEIIELLTQQKKKLSPPTRKQTPSAEQKEKSPQK